MSKSIKIVGMQYTIPNWKGLFNSNNIGMGDLVELKKEPDNKYDKNAIACFKDDVKIGYVSKNMTSHVFEGTYEIVGLGFYEINIVEIDYEDDIIDALANTDGEDFFNEDEEDEFIDDLANGRFL